MRGKRQLWKDLPFLERLARSRKPWCILDKEERKEVLENMKPALKYWVTLWKEFDRFRDVEEFYEAYFTGDLDPGT